MSNSQIDPFHANIQSVAAFICIHAYDAHLVVAATGAMHVYIYYQCSWLLQIMLFISIMCKHCHLQPTEICILLCFYIFYIALFTT
jgi:hypothetical protein